MQKCGTGMALDLKISGGGRQKNVGGIIFHLVEIGLTYLPKTGGGGHMPPGPPFVTGLLFTSRTKMHSGAKIQNSYKILSIDTYYKGKLAFQERLLSCKKYIHDILYIL